MSWQALADQRRADFDDDESWVALEDAWNAAYEAAALAAWPRLEARLALTAAAGPTDQWVANDEWVDILDKAGVHDAVNDIINDGIISVAQDLGIPLNDRMLEDNVNDFVLSAVDAIDFIRDMLDTFHDQNRSKAWTRQQWRSALRDQPSSPLSTGRAQRFARSQANGALNAGYRAGLNACGLTRRPEFAATTPHSCDAVAALRWVTQRDERVRPAHEAADQDTVLVDQTFTIDGHPARYPGDPTLPIGLRINCRCVLAWVDGTEVRRVAGALKSELYLRARELDIRGRSTMTKAELQSAILEELCLQGLAGGPDCPDLFDQMNRTALMTYARREQIVGRWRMTKPELVERLRATMRGGDRLRVRQGYVPRAELDSAQRLAARKRRVITKATDMRTGPIPDAAARRAARDEVFAEFGGPDRGYAPCAFCGLKLHPNPAEGLAVLVPTPIRPFSAGGTAAAANMLPGCTACFQAHSTAATLGALAASAGLEGEQWDSDDDIILLAPEVRVRHEARIAAMPEPDGDAEFHLQGQHDQQTHGNRGGRNLPTDTADQMTVVEDIYGGTFKDDQGFEYRLEGYQAESPDIYAEPYGISAEGMIFTDDEMVGEFVRRYDFERGMVSNIKLVIEDGYRNHGIGSAFLDHTEKAAADAGFTQVEVTAVAIGRYAWAARGYRLEADRDEVRQTWAKTAMAVARTRLTKQQHADTIKVLDHWNKNPNDVYPADLLAISPDMRTVFLNGPTWSGVRDLDQPDELPLAASGPIRSWRQFHLQGQHDQKSHGNRHGKAPSGAEVLSEDVDQDWADREGNDRLSGEGDCFVVAAQMVTDKLGADDEDDWRLVHGVVTGQEQLDGVRFDHGWVEHTERVRWPDDMLERLPEDQRDMMSETTTEFVIDRSNGNDITLPKALYYKVGDIDEATVRRYSPSEAATKMVATGHYGPWDEDE